MIERPNIELIHADVDGELPEPHRAELNRYLLADPARVVRDELIGSLPRRSTRCLR